MAVRLERPAMKDDSDGFGAAAGRTYSLDAGPRADIDLQSGGFAKRKLRSTTGLDAPTSGGRFGADNQECQCGRSRPGEVGFWHGGRCRVFFRSWSSGI